MHIARPIGNHPCPLPASETPPSRTQIVERIPTTPFPPTQNLPTCIGVQALLALSGATSGVAGANHDLVSVICTGPPVLPSDSPTRPPALLPSDLVPTRMCRVHRSPAGISQIAVTYASDQSDPASSPPKRDQAPPCADLYAFGFMR